MGYRGRKGIKWKQKEKQFIKSWLGRACKESSWALTVPAPQSSPGSSTSHVFWNLSPPRGGGRWPLSGLLSGPGKRLLSQLLVTSVQYEGEGAPGLWDVFQAVEKS